MAKGNRAAITTPPRPRRGTAASGQSPSDQVDMAKLWRGKDEAPETAGWKSVTVKDLPMDVQAEIGLPPETTLRVKQRATNHIDDGIILRRSADRTTKDPEIDPMALLQNVIDATVEASNFGLPEQPISLMRAPAFAWWLFSWLGCDAIQRRIKHATDTYLSTKKNSP